MSPLHKLVKYHLNVTIVTFYVGVVKDVMVDGTKETKLPRVVKAHC